MLLRKEVKSLMELNAHLIETHKLKTNLYRGVSTINTGLANDKQILVQANRKLSSMLKSAEQPKHTKNLSKMSSIKSFKALKSTKPVKNLKKTYLDRLAFSFNSQFLTRLRQKRSRQTSFYC